MIWFALFLIFNTSLFIYFSFRRLRAFNFKEESAFDFIFLNAAFLIFTSITGFFWLAPLFLLANFRRERLKLLIVFLQSYLLFFSFLLFFRLAVYRLWHSLPLALALLFMFVVTSFSNEFIEKLLAKLVEKVKKRGKKAFGAES